MARTRARRDDPSPLAVAPVLRGLLDASGLSADELRANAQLNHDLYGFYGTSVWVADPEHTVDELERTTLRKFDHYAVFTAADLQHHDLVLWPTGQKPHYDVVYGDGSGLAQLVDNMLSTPYAVRTNRHVDREEH